MNEVLLQKSEVDKPYKLKNLMSETQISALLDCGASMTICRKEWLTQYMNNLSEQDERKVSFGQTNHIHRFGGW